MNRHDEGLGEGRLPLAERVDCLLGGDQRLLGGDERFERVDIDPVREMLAMAEEDSRAQRRVIIVVMVGRRSRGRRGNRRLHVRRRPKKRSFFGTPIPTSAS
jgi:hypothetical protein